MIMDVKVPNGRWHCQICAVCVSCGTKEPFEEGKVEIFIRVDLDLFFACRTPDIRQALPDNPAFSCRIPDIRSRILII